MEIVGLRPGDALWEAVAAYAEGCSWLAGTSLSQPIPESRFQAWERVFTLVEGASIAGYCTLVEVDCLDVPYRPFIGYVFVGEPYRGRRLSERLIRAAMAYAGGLGYPQVYICTDHIGLYEKYGFRKIGEAPAPWDPAKAESIFVQETGAGRRT